MPRSFLTPAFVPLKKVVTIQPAAIASLFTTPVQLVAGIPDMIVLPTNLHVRKEAGTAWTTTGSGVLQVKYTSPGAATHWALFDQTTMDAFFAAGESVWVAEAGKGSFSGLGDTTSANLNNGVGTSLTIATADISGGTGNLIVELWYRLWPGLNP